MMIGRDSIAHRKARLATLRATLSATKQGRLEAALTRGLVENSRQGIISHRPHEGVVPLSFAQQRLWFLDQLEPNGSMYNLPVSVHLSGHINITGLEQSANEVIRRHESLRTNFSFQEGEPFQVIASVRTLDLPIVDLSGLPVTERRAQVRRLISVEGQGPFDLAKELLIRVILLRQAKDEHVVLLTMHHIVSDRWSMGIFIDEMGQLYGAFSAGEPSQLPELPIQYADYSYWQRQWLQGKVLEEETRYWKQQLKGVSTLNLPTDRPRPAVQTFKGSSKWLALSEDLTDGLQALVRREGSTMFIVLLAAFQILLSRYSGQDDIAVGTPIAGRNCLETEGLIGFFINTLVMRTNLYDNHSLRELIGRVRETVLESQAHQHLPFEKLVEELQPERSLSYGPIFQVMFILNNTPPGELKVKEVAFKPVNSRHSEVKFDLTLSMVEGKRLSGVLLYNTDLFDQTTAARMTNHYRLLIEAMVAHPEKQLRALPALTEAESHQTVIEWNQSQTRYDRDQFIHKLIEAQVQEAPDAIAVIDGDQQWSYARLNGNANRLAHYLVKIGVGPEVRVALYLERGFDSVVALLGILKAGGTYIPLDCKYPIHRLTYMLEDSRAEIMLSHRSLAEAWTDSIKVIYLDSHEDRIAQECKENPEVKLSAENLAYVIYTSGSTGHPKGVAVAQGGLVNFIKAMTHRFDLRAADTLLAVTSLSFDISMLEIYLPLVCGSRVVIADKESSADGNQLIQLLADSGATCLQATPATWRLLLDSGWDGKNGIKILCGGEALPRDLADRLLDRSDFVWNLYGPTETTIWSALSPVLEGSETVPIGRPIDNTQLYVLDRTFRTVPIGVPGELYIGGDGLARGYLNRPEITAERFIPDSFAPESGSRRYRTGDLARYRRDGQIEFLGRIDHQVKVRGFRIELGEIEAVLSQHPKIDHVAVVAHEDQSGEHKLIAYLEEENQLSDGELREYLQGKLPDYMTPSIFVKLERFPLTPNGKIDRRAFPIPDVNSVSRNVDQPATAIEAILHGIWAEILGLERFGIHQNFFELGGHSLQATRVISRIRNAFELKMPLRAVFENPTIAELARLVERGMNADRGLVAPPVRRRNGDHGGTLSYAQQRLWFLDKLNPGSSAYNIPAAVRFVGSLNLYALENSLSEIIRRHEVLRTVFIEDGDRCLQLATGPLPLKLMVVDLSQLGETERETQSGKLAEEEAQRPFDLLDGPHLRFRLLKLSDGDHVIFFTMHHIVSDGWSTRLFTQEVRDLYQVFSEGDESNLPELPIQYGDFAAWQREWLDGEVLETQLRYWKQHLGGQLPLLNLRTGRPRPAVPSYRGERKRITIGVETTALVKSLSQRENVTLFMTLLAAFDVLLYRYSGQEDLIVGTDVANRNCSEVENLIGFFINQLVMRVDLSGNPTFQELLGRVRTIALGAYAHQDLPFDKLVEVLRPDRVLNRSPLFQVKIILQNIPSLSERGDLTIDERLKFKAFSADLFKTSKLDLNLIVLDAPKGLTCSLEYSTDLFDNAMISRFLKQFNMVLEQAATRPDLRLNELVDLINEEDKRELTRWQKEVKATRRQKHKDFEIKPISGLKKHEGLG